MKETLEGKVRNIEDSLCRIFRAEYSKPEYERLAMMHRLAYGALLAKSAFQALEEKKINNAELDTGDDIDTEDDIAQYGENYVTFHSDTPYCFLAKRFIENNGMSCYIGFHPFQDLEKTKKELKPLLSGNRDIYTISGRLNVMMGFEIEREFWSPEKDRLLIKATAQEGYRLVFNCGSEAEPFFHKFLEQFEQLLKEYEDGKWNLTINYQS